MAKCVSKFEQLIRNLKYNQIQLRELNIDKVESWCNTYMPEVVQELISLGWDLSNDLTWSETVFVSTLLKWYDLKVALFITPSILDYNLANKIIKTKAFKKFRADFSIDTHTTVLVNNIIFLLPDDLDSIYLTFDLSKGYSSIDFSHFDEDENLDSDYVQEWKWLMLEENDNDSWESTNYQQVFDRKTVQNEIKRLKLYEQVYP